MNILSAMPVKIMNPVGAKTFVAVPPSEPTRVMGYYSISPGAIEFARVPAELTKKLGRYEVPVFRLGRLAVSLSVQGQGQAATDMFDLQPPRHISTLH
jgi:hypothetical protein